MVKAFEKDDVNEIYRILTERIIEGEEAPVAEITEPPESEVAEATSTEGGESKSEIETPAEAEVAGLQDSETAGGGDTTEDEDDEEDLVPELPDAEPGTEKPFSWDEVEKAAAEEPKKEPEQEQEQEQSPELLTEQEAPELEPEPEQEHEEAPAQVRPTPEPEPMPEPIKITRMEEAPPVGLPMRQSMIWKENSSRLPVNFGAIREVPVPKGESVHFKNESGAAHFKNEAKGEKVVNQETRFTVVPGDTLWTVTVKANHIEVLSGDGDVHLIFARGGKNIVRINGYIFKMDGDEISLAPDYPGVP